MKKLFVILSVVTALVMISVSCGEHTPYKALVITSPDRPFEKSSGQIVKKVLEQTNLFSVKILKTPSESGETAALLPDLSRFNLVVVDYEGNEWSEKDQLSLVSFVKNGGGALIFGNAVAATSKWKSFGEINMITGLDANGKAHEFEVRFRNTEHPLAAGLPVRWIHTSDVLASKLEGIPANAEILATAFSDTTFGGSGKSEPVIYTMNTGKGRIFETTLGCDDGGDNPAMKCAGFLTIIQRGAEWAAAGVVNQKVPFDFPSAAVSVSRPDLKPLSIEDDMEGLMTYQVEKSTRYMVDIQARLRDAAGNSEELRIIEGKMVEVLNNNLTTIDAKKLILRELSWMGSDYCLPAIKELINKPELKDEAEFALSRLNLK